ncbi:SDR family oxidoreductase [Nocardia camponoti]|uniref:3-oxoacyl-[acyl-carrier-protein] reductase MabA n=1 Tax=Nocardia camponoti TaxID=1616106 RepID=A0A917V4L9_9NOCA|nr:SDR family oxidoreductase [Nocardia camponoti]GGK36633.1 short chain dehydrogenase [Nocardia camponoti]
MAEQKSILVTGSSRGIGADAARVLAARGHRVVVNYREKRRRAEGLVAEIEGMGGSAVAFGADLTVDLEVAEMVSRILADSGGLDGLVLNASGGLERGADADYATRINVDAQLRVLDAVLPHLRRGSRVVFVTSHQAHFVDSHGVPGDYGPVARSKRLGENAIRAREPELAAAGVGLSVVSGDMIEGTMIVRLLTRRDPDAVNSRRDVVPLPTVEEFAEAIADEVVRTGVGARTVFVGGSDYLVGA